jgi:hypothetical protein
LSQVHTCHCVIPAWLQGLTLYPCQNKADKSVCLFRYMLSNDSS